MGIKGYAEEIEMQRLCTDLYCSIYGELGPGERIALSKLAVEHFERTGRPLRIAVDISIWQFQIQSGKGGSNPALRTLYYRLLRLLALNIQPLFVFDGPHKPPSSVMSVRSHTQHVYRICWRSSCSSCLAFPIILRQVKQKRSAHFFSKRAS